VEIRTASAEQIMLWPKFSAYIALQGRRNAIEKFFLRGELVYFLLVVPGVVLASSGEEGLSWPLAFSGVSERTPIWPGPAVEGLSPLGPDGWTATCLGVGVCVGAGDLAVWFLEDINLPFAISTSIGGGVEDSSCPLFANRWEVR